MVFIIHKSYYILQALRSRAHCDKHDTVFFFTVNATRWTVKAKSTKMECSPIKINEPTTIHYFLVRISGDFWRFSAMACMTSSFEISLIFNSRLLLAYLNGQWTPRWLHQFINIAYFRFVRTVRRYHLPHSGIATFRWGRWSKYNSACSIQMTTKAIAKRLWCDCRLLREKVCHSHIVVITLGSIVNREWHEPICPKVISSIISQHIRSSPFPLLFLFGSTQCEMKQIQFSRKWGKLQTSEVQMYTLDAWTFMNQFGNHPNIGDILLVAAQVKWCRSCYGVGSRFTKWKLTGKRERKTRLNWQTWPKIEYGACNGEYRKGWVSLNTAVQGKFVHKIEILHIVWRRLLEHAVQTTKDEEKLLLAVG